MLVAEWQWDDENVAHIARHGLRPRDIRQVAENDPRFRRNRKGRAATHQMVGPDDGGRFVAAFLVAVPGTPGRWRVVTARPATPAERQWWEKT